MRDKLLAENTRAFTRNTFEKTCEVLRIPETEVVGNDADVGVCGCEASFGFGNQS